MCETPQLLLEAEKSRGQRECEEEETEEKWIKEEEDYPCVFERETLSEHIKGSCIDIITSGTLPYRKFTPVLSSSVLVSWRLVVDRLSVLFLRLLLSLQRLQHLLWWILELHIVKIVSCYIIWVCVKEVRSVCLSV